MAKERFYKLQLISIVALVCCNALTGCDMLTPNVEFSASVHRIDSAHEASEMHKMPIKCLWSGDCGNVEAKGS